MYGSEDFDKNFQIRDMVLDFDPASIYYFELDTDENSWSKFSLFLKELFARFGGWVGSYGNNWELIYVYNTVNVIGSPLPFARSEVTAKWQGQDLPKELSVLCKHSNE